MKYRDKIIQYFEELPNGTVIVANELYETNFSKMSETAFFKALERLSNDGIIERIARGIYMTGSDNCEEHLLNFFFGENNESAIYIGSKLYKKYGITEFDTDEIHLYSNRISKGVCNIGRIHVKRVDIELTYENARIIEAFEILQNYGDIDGLNKLRFARYAKQFAKGYDDAAAVNVIAHLKYKKSTIAFMKKILDMYKVPNSLQNYLSHASKYKVPPVQRIAK